MFAFTRNINKEKILKEGVAKGNDQNAECADQERPIAHETFYQNYANGIQNEADIREEDEEAPSKGEPAKPAPRHDKLPQ